MIAELSALTQSLRTLRIGGEELRQVQDEKLRRVVSHAYEQVPFYRKRFEEAGLHPSQIQGLQDLDRIPITTKADLRAAGERARVRESLPLERCRRAYTSGSSGEPFAVLLDRRDLARRNAQHFRSMLSIGVGPRERLVHVGPIRWPAKRWTHRLGIWPREYVSPAWPPTRQLEELRRFAPDVLWTAPTRLRALWEAAGRDFRNLGQPRAVILGAECLDPAMTREMREQWGVEIFNFYGSVEFGRIARECTAHEGLHVDADLLHLELLPTQVTEGDQSLASTVVTQLEVNAMPLLRYDLGDLASWLTDEPCTCGSHFPRIQPPRGRNHRVVLLPSGRTLSSSIFSFLLREFTVLRRYRVVQETPGLFRILIDPLPGAGAPPLAEIEGRVLEALGEDVEVVCEEAALTEDAATKFVDFETRLEAARGASA